MGHTTINDEQKDIMYTGEFDFDILGHNPLKKYGRDPKNTDPNTIILPPQDGLCNQKFRCMEKLRCSILLLFPKREWEMQLDDYAL